MDEFAEYEAVVERVDAFVATVSARRASAISCRAGCDGCCRVRLSVTPIEAARVGRAIEGLPAATREKLARAAGDESRCALLDESGRCSIYEARPLVCRTQGLPLRYPTGTLPEGSVYLRIEGGEGTWCPLNFREAKPSAADHLDAERVDQLLGVVNLRWARAAGIPADERIELSSLL